MSAVALEGVHKSFGTHEVLGGIDLTLEEHEVVCLIGASGSGKSTLLRCVNLLEPLDAGRILLHGEVITRRIACGRITRRNAWKRASPSDRAAASWLGCTDSIPAR